MENIDFNSLQKHLGKVVLPEPVVPTKSNNAKPIILNGMVIGYIPVPTKVISVIVDTHIKSVIEGTDDIIITVPCYLRSVDVDIFRLFMYVGFDETVEFDKTVNFTMRVGEVLTSGVETDELAD